MRVGKHLQTTNPRLFPISSSASQESVVEEDYACPPPTKRRKLKISFADKKVDYEFAEGVPTVLTDFPFTELEGREMDLDGVVPQISSNA